MEMSNEEMFAEMTTSLRRVIALTGCANDGKTSTLKLLIRELYESDPSSWRGRQPFNFSRVELCKGSFTCEYTGVFEINGVIVVIRTGGDSTRLLLSNFSAFYKYKAEIGVTAVRIVENEKTVSQIWSSFQKVETSVGFVSETVPIRGRKLRTEESELCIARQIKERIYTLTAEIAAQKKGEAK